jgi:hypothetical protein
MNKRMKGDMGKATLNTGLFDPRRGDQAIRIERLDLTRKPFEPARTNYFSAYLIESGSDAFWADVSHVAFSPIMIGAALVTMADSAKTYLRKRVHSGAGAASEWANPVPRRRICCRRRAWGDEQDCEVRGDAGGVYRSKAARLPTRDLRPIFAFHGTGFAS